MDTIFEIILITLLVIISVVLLKRYDKKIGLTRALQGIGIILYKHYPWFLFGTFVWLMLLYLRFGIPD